MVVTENPASWSVTALATKNSRGGAGFRHSVIQGLLWCHQGSSFCHLSDFHSTGFVLRLTVGELWRLYPCPASTLGSKPEEKGLPLPLQATSLIGSYWSQSGPWTLTWGIGSMTASGVGGSQGGGYTIPSKEDWGIATKRRRQDATINRWAYTSHFGCC